MLIPAPIAADRFDAGLDDEVADVLAVFEAVAGSDKVATADVEAAGVDEVAVDVFSAWATPKKLPKPGAFMVKSEVSQQPAAARELPSTAPQHQVTV